MSCHNDHISVPVSVSVSVSKNALVDDYGPAQKRVFKGSIVQKHRREVLYNSFFAGAYSLFELSFADLARILELHGIVDYDANVICARGLIIDHIMFGK